MSIYWANGRSPGRRGSGYSRNKRPVDPNDPLVCEAFQRLGKNEIGCAFSFFEADDSKVRPALALLNCHDPIALYLRFEDVDRQTAFARECTPAAYRIFRSLAKSAPFLL